MKYQVGERLHIAFQLLHTNKGVIGVIETGVDQGYTTRCLITQPQQLHDVVFEIGEVLRQHGKNITHFPDRHGDIFKQHVLKDF